MLAGVIHSNFPRGTANWGLIDFWVEGEAGKELGTYSVLGSAMGASKVVASKQWFPTCSLLIFQKDNFHLQSKPELYFDNMDLKNLIGIFKSTANLSGKYSFPYTPPPPTAYIQLPPPSMSPISVLYISYNWWIYTDTSLSRKVHCLH